MDQKFHINSAGDVRVCNATTRPCRFSPSDHFTDRVAARQAVEERLSEEMPTTTSLSKKKTRSVKSDESEQQDDSQFKSRIAKLTQNKKPSNADLQAIGAVIDDELRSRLDFDPFDHELSDEEIAAVQNANREIFSSLVKNGGDIPTVVNGPFAKKLHDAVRILPDNVKADIGRNPIFTKTVNKNNRIDGQHRFGQIPQIVKSRTQVYPGMIPEEAPEGALVPFERHHTFRTISEYTGIRVLAKNSNSGFAEDHWIGEKPKNTKARKIADQAEIYIDGNLVTLNKPVYELYTEEKTMASQITSKKAEDTNEGASVLLHEFCHAVQRRTVGKNILDEAEGTMYDELTYGEKTYDFDYGIIKRKGFPNGYMAHENGEELLPVATEAFFHPSTVNKGFLYGSDRGENADKVRQWVSGLWVSLGNP